MYLSWDLVDRNQSVLTRLDNRLEGGKVEIGLNGSRRAFCPLSLEDPALAVATAMDSFLRVILRGDDFSLPLFLGRVLTPEESDDAESHGLGLTAIDAFLQVERSLIRSVSGSEWDPVTYAAKDQSAIMWALVQMGTGHGIVAGDLPASVNRDRTYPPGKEVGAALVEMSEVIGGPDFELQPVLADDGTMAKLNTFYPQQGSDLSETVRFQHGGEGEDAPGFTYSPTGEGLCNRVLVIGAPVNADGEGEGEKPYAFHYGYVAEDAASIERYGAFEVREQAEDVTEAATLRAHAEAIVAGAAYPVPYFDFTAAPEKVEGETGIGIPPIFGRDYWLGDIVGLDAYLNGADPAKGDEPTHALAGRITDVVVTELASGQIQVKSTCSPAISAAGVTGYAVTVKVPNTEED